MASVVRQLEYNSEINLWYSYGLKQLHLFWTSSLTMGYICIGTTYTVYFIFINMHTVVLCFVFLWFYHQFSRIRERRTRFPNHRLQRKPLVNDPVMHHGTCVTHVPWCMSGSLSRGCRKNVHGIHGACATRNFTYLARGIWMRYLERDNGVYGDIRPANPQHLNYSHHRVNISRNVGMEAWYRQLKLLILSILQHSFIITLDRWI